MAVRRGVQLPGKDLGVADARAHGAGLAPREPDPAADGRAVALVGLEIGDVDDVRRSRRELRHLGRAGGGLAGPRMILLRADRRPGLAEPRHPGAREPGDAVREGALPECEHVEAVGPGLQRVRVLERAVHEAVARSDRVADGIALSLPLHRDTGAGRGRRRSPPRRPRDGAGSTTCPGRPGSASRPPCATRVR